MPSFDTLARWERYVPALGNNRELEKPFFLKVRAGLTKPEFEAYREAERAFWRRQAQGEAETPAAENVEAALEGATTPAESPLDMLEKALARVVEMGTEPLSVNGVAVTTLRA